MPQKVLRGRKQMRQRRTEKKVIFIFDVASYWISIYLFEETAVVYIMDNC
jgi:hypothetical protein